MTTSALYEWFRETASNASDAPALTFLLAGENSEVKYTYAELIERVETLGDKLASVYQDRTAPLGLLMASQEDQVLHYLAGLYAGVVPAILTPPNRKLNREYYAQTMTAVLSQCRFGAVVSDVEGVDLPTQGIEPYTFDSLPSTAPSETWPASRELDASFMQFSSGTTGIKRGVLVDDNSVTAQLEAYSSAIGLNEDDCILSWLPLYHDMGFIACLNMPLAYGVHTVMIDPIRWVSNPAVYLQAVSKYRATLSWHPNFAFSFMAQRVRDVDLDDVELSSLRGLVNCSEPVTYESQKAFADRFGPKGLSADVFKGCYAMAETTFALTHGESTDPNYVDPVGPTDGTKSGSAAGYVSVGRVIDGVELSIRDPEDFQELPERVVGEIWVRSPFNFSGYYNDPEATEASFVNDWYRTGDLGYRVGEAFYVAGRLKDVLIVGGVNVFPQDLEDLVSEVEGIQEGRVSAFGVFDERAQTDHIVILAESSHHGTAREREIVVEVRQRILAAFQIANFEVQLIEPGWLVKSTSGKMARTANRDKWTSRSTSEHEV